MYFQDFDSFNQGLRGLGLDADEPGPPIDDGDVEEALGHFTMRLKVTKVYSPEQSSTTHPVVHFRGTSKVVYPNRTVPNPVSRIIGNVCLGSTRLFLLAPNTDRSCPGYTPRRSALDNNFYP